MKRLFWIVLFLLTVLGCRTATLLAENVDAAAVDLAVATIASRRVPAPPQPAGCPRCCDTGWITHGDGHRTPCPDCNAEDAGLMAGPLDAFRDAKELIRKGNVLADRGQALLDAAQRDGKITVDVRLPDPDAGGGHNPPLAKALETRGSDKASTGSCPGGVCRMPPAVAQRSTTATPPALWQRHRSSVSRPRLFRSFRR